MRLQLAVVAALVAAAAVLRQSTVPVHGSARAAALASAHRTTTLAGADRVDRVTATAVRGDGFWSAVVGGIIGAALGAISGGGATAIMLAGALGAMIGDDPGACGPSGDGGVFCGE
jgi:hypothetical protein